MSKSPYVPKTSHSEQQTGFVLENRPKAMIFVRDKHLGSSAKHMDWLWVNVCTVNSSLGQSDRVANPTQF
jgi:hypothetical protein